MALGARSCWGHQATKWYARQFWLRFKPKNVGRGQLSCRNEKIKKKWYGGISWMFCCFKSLGENLVGEAFLRILSTFFKRIDTTTRSTTLLNIISPTTTVNLLRWLEPNPHRPWTFEMDRFVSGHRSHLW